MFSRFSEDRKIGFTIQALTAIMTTRTQMKLLPIAGTIRFEMAVPHTAGLLTPRLLSVLDFTFPPDLLVSSINVTYTSKPGIERRQKSPTACRRFIPSYWFYL